MLQPPAEKHCSKCDETKPVNDFYANRGRYDGLDVYCKECTLAYNKSQNRRAKRSRNSKAVKGSVDFYMHGLTPKDY